MFHYELHQLRQHDLVSEATAARRAREAGRSRFITRRSGEYEGEGRVNPPLGRGAASPRRATV